MAETFLSLVNKVCRRMGEVELTSVTFSSARGFHAGAKDAVNYGVRRINQIGIQWPFNYTSTTQVLTPGTNRYAFPSGTLNVDFESFRLLRDSSVDVNETRQLPIMSYDDYLRLHARQDSLTYSEGKVPENVFRANNLAWGVYPMPDKAYSVLFEHYSIPSEMVAHGDTTTIPDQFSWVIVEGAMHWIYMFRDNMEAAAKQDKEVLAGIKLMRTILINENEDVSSTMIVR